MTAIVWKDASHKQRFTDAMQQHVYDGWLDSNYGAAIYILSADPHMWNQAQYYVGQNGILFDKMINDLDLTGGTYTLLHLAGNLFTAGSIKSSPNDIAGRLDDSNYQIAISAIHIRRHSLRLDDLK